MKLSNAICWLNGLFSPGIFQHSSRLLLCFLTISLMIPRPVKAQPETSAIDRGRLTKVIVVESVITTATMIGLHYLWYKKFPRSRFHLFNDNGEWMLMDKIGHAATGYNVSAIQYDMMRWSGVDNRTASWVGGLTAFGLQTLVELFDGYSSQWGFSPGDMLANFSGAALFVGQQLTWGEQRARLKFSFHKTLYSGYSKSELGSNRWQRWLKDYNGQTYWLSVNPASFLRSNTSFPSYLNVAIGYGAEGMLAARSNPTAINGKPVPEFPRVRRWLLSPDIDFKKIHPGDKPQALLSLPSILKVPAPALEWKKTTGTRFHWIYF